jgi:pSer/pThr/pTyr-binding forkhead associated (FHA) protein
MSATLKVISGPGAGQSAPLDGEIVIGREGADITIDDPELSRRHVAIRPAGQGVEIQDLDSMNGTFVNGERISQPVTLTVGGTVRVGSTEIAVELPVAATRVSDVPAAPGEIAPAGAPTKVGDVISPAGAPTKVGDVIAPAGAPTKAGETIPAAGAPTKVGETIPAAGAPTKVGEVIAPAGAPTKVGETISPAGAPTKVGNVPGAAPPPPAAPPPTAPPPPAPQTAEPPAAPPQPPAAPPAAPAQPPAPSRGGPPWIPILIGVLVVAAVAVVLFLVLGGDDDASAEAHPLNGDVRTAVLSTPGALTTVGGIEDSKATGRMSVLVIRHVKDQPTPGGGPVPLQLDVTFSSPKGSFFGLVHGTVRISAKGEEIVRGKAKFSKGTGDFEDISGDFSIAGDNQPNTTISRFKLQGSADF